MKKLFTLLLPLCVFFSANAQMISYELIGSFTVTELTEMMDDLGVPPTAIEVEYPVNAYRVLYNTPYKNMDTWVQASGAIFVPQDVMCPLPISVYHHGTQADINGSASNLAGGQWEVAVLFAATGYIVSCPDYLGLGYPDPLVEIHPYQHAFSQGNTSINMIRSTREMCDDINIEMNGQLFLFGYSQGGFATMAAHRIIEEQYPDEFTITASAPMSGAYDMGGAQADLIGSDAPYPTPGYLPYLILAYESMYDNMYDEVSEVMIAPYDTLIPPLFYGGEVGIGYINEQCNPVPKNMMQEEVINDFYSNPDHPFRLNLEDNDQLNWAPQAPVKLLFCTADEQVYYMNSINAYDTWTANGSPNIEMHDYGNFSHNECALFCFLDGKNYFDNLRIDCSGTAIEETPLTSLSVYPNPANSFISFKNAPQGSRILIYDLPGQLLKIAEPGTQIDISTFNQGVYIYQAELNDKLIANGSFNVIR